MAVLMVACCFVFTSCGSTDEDDFKIGIICLHDEKSTYDKNFIDAVYAAQKALGLKDNQVLIVTNVPEGDECYQQAANLVDQGCKVIFADSFGHEDFMIKAAKAFPEVQFCHATGVKAKTEGLSNFHNAFSSIYEGRYLAGVAAGLKLNEMISSGKITADNAKMGYVGAFTYAEVISGYTSFYLGAKSVCPSVTMEVQFTGSWFDITEEKNAAEALIDRGCVLISQHADSMGAPSACEAKGVPNISYNLSNADTCPNSFIIASKINWQPYFEYIIKTVKDGENGGKIDTDWCGSLANGSVVVTAVNEKAAAAGTQAKLDEVAASLKNGSLKVFDTSTFTVGGQKLTTYKVGDVEVIKDGYFSESDVSLYRSGPYFEIAVDGITRLNEKFGD